MSDLNEYKTEKDSDLVEVLLGIRESLMDVSKRLDTEYEDLVQYLENKGINIENI